MWSIKTLLKWFWNLKMKSDTSDMRGWKRRLFWMPAVIFRLSWTTIVWKLDIYFWFAQWQRVTLVDRVIVTEFEISQGSVAALCRWCEQVSNCCVVDYLNILYTKFYRNWPKFVETTEKLKVLLYWKFLVIHSFLFCGMLCSGLIAWVTVCPLPLTLIFSCSFNVVILCKLYHVAFYFSFNNVS